MKNKLFLPANHKIVLMYEGSAEKAIVENLLDNDNLIFNRDDLLENKIFKRCSLKVFCKSHLSHEMSNKVLIIRIIDSKSEEPKIPPVYEHKIEDVITILTTPEIEILNIISQGKYKDYKKSHSNLKPSEYTAKYLRSKKSFIFHKKFWNQNDLVSSIREYGRITNNSEYNLNDLLRV